MKTFVQFLTRQNNTIVSLGGSNDKHILDERKSLNSLIVDSFDQIEKHSLKNDIVGFNIIEVDSFQNKETIINQNIFDY